MLNVKKKKEGVENPCTGMKGTEMNLKPSSWSAATHLVLIVQLMCSYKPPTVRDLFLENSGQIM